MPEPAHVVSLGDRTKTGLLRSRDITLIREQLLRGGFVLLPSDTCYSLAMVPHDKGRRDMINGILDRPEDWPMSVAFSSINSVRRFVDLSPVAARILEAFTPGPITVVCESRPDPDVLMFVTEGIGSLDATIGVRIPDSPIEREVASCTDHPVTTVAVRDREGKPIRSFEQALEQVETATRLVSTPGWCAIQGDDDMFFGNHSTVVRVSGDTVRDMRNGDLPFDEILRATRDLPPSLREEAG